MDPYRRRRGVGAGIRGLSVIIEAVILFSYLPQKLVTETLSELYQTVSPILFN